MKRWTVRVSKDFIQKKHRPNAVRIVLSVTGDVTLKALERLSVAEGLPVYAVMPPKNYASREVDVMIFDGRWQHSTSDVVGASSMVIRRLREDGKIFT